MTYLIEYLGKFDFIFETVLGYVSGDQMGSFEAKNRSQKSHASAPLSLFLSPPLQPKFGKIGSIYPDLGL